MKIEINGVNYEVIKEIPINLTEFFLVNDNSILDYNNSNFSDIFLIKIDDNEKKEIKIKADMGNEVIKIILLMKNNCSADIKIVSLQNSNEESNIDFLSLLYGRGSKLILNSLCFSNGTGKINFTNRCFCLEKRNKVNMILKSIARDKSRIFNEAAAFIDKNAEKTDLNVSEKGIFFDDSKIEFFPNLKIENNDVIAGHSAYAKKFSLGDLFYLMSRGLDLNKSRDLLLEGFIDEFFEFNLKI